MESCYLLFTHQSWQEHAVLMCDKDKTVGMHYDKNVSSFQETETFAGFHSQS